MIFTWLHPMKKSHAPKDVGKMCPQAFSNVFLCQQEERTVSKLQLRFEHGSLEREAHWRFGSQNFRSTAGTRLVQHEGNLFLAGIHNGIHIVYVSAKSGTEKTSQTANVRMLICRTFAVPSKHQPWQIAVAALLASSLANGSRNTRNCRANQCSKNYLCHWHFIAFNGFWTVTCWVVLRTVVCFDRCIDILPWFLITGMWASQHCNWITRMRPPDWNWESVLLMTAMWLKRASALCN